MGKDKVLKQLLERSGVVLLGNTGASALNFISFSIVVNQLGAQLFALFVLTQTYTLIINSLFNIQTWESMVKFGLSKGPENNFSNVVKTNFVMDLASAIVAFLVSILMVKTVVGLLDWDPQISQLMVLYSFSILFNLTTFTIGIPRLFNKFSSVARVQVGMAFLKLVCVLFAVVLSKTIVFYVTIYLLVDVFRNLVLILYSTLLLKEGGLGGWWREKLRTDFKQIRFIWWTNLRSIVRIPVQYCDVVIISMVMSLEAVGVYKVYKEVAGLMGRLGDPVNQTIYPEYARLIGGNDSEAAVALTKKMVLVLLGGSILVSLLLILASKLLIGKVYGPEFLSSINGLYILILLYGVSLFSVPVNSLFIAAGFVKYGFYIVVFTNTLYLMVAYGFGKFFGIFGIILAYGVQMVFNQGLKIIILKTNRMGWSESIR